MKALSLFLLRLFSSFIIYIIAYKTVEVLIVGVIRAGVTLGRLLRPIEKRDRGVKTGLTVSDFTCSFAWVILAISLIFLSPICLVLFIFNILFWRQLILFIGLMIFVSFILFFFDTALFYDYFRDIYFVYGKDRKKFDRMKEDTEFGLDWKGYLDNMPITPFKKIGFADKYRR